MKHIKGFLFFILFLFTITTIVRYISDEINRLSAQESDNTIFVADKDLEKAAQELAEKVNNQPVISSSSESVGEIVAAVPKEDTLPYEIINGNVPFFTPDEITTQPFEIYSELDNLGRCGVAYANIGKELMPTEERGEIGYIKPTGWHTVKYPNTIKDRYLYNRCHLIAFCLAGENDNDKNLITGTRYFNVEGMLPFENKVLYYVKDTGNHVLYRVTPVFEGNNLVASGVIMEAFSVEDNGKGVCFNVFIYNKQPGITIDYTTGDSFENTIGINDQIQIYQYLSLLS